MGPLFGNNTMPWYDFCHIKSLKFPLSLILEISVILEKKLFTKSQLTDWKFISEIFIAYSHNSAYFPHIFRKFWHQNCLNCPILTMLNIRLTSPRFSAHSLSSFILTFRRCSLHLFVIRNRPNRFISKKYFQNGVWAPLWKHFF